MEQTFVKYSMYALGVLIGFSFTSKILMDVGFCQVLAYPLSIIMNLAGVYLIINKNGK